MDGWMGGWMDGWLGGGWVEWMDGWVGGWTDGRVGRWTGGWMDGWTGGWMDVNCIWVTPGGSNTVHIYIQTIHRPTQLIWEECGPCPGFTSYTLVFAVQLRKKHGKTSVRVLTRVFSTLGALRLSVFVLTKRLLEPFQIQ
jgi:hypothetical protein